MDVRWLLAVVLLVLAGLWIYAICLHVLYLLTSNFVDQSRQRFSLLLELMQPLLARLGERWRNQSIFGDAMKLHLGGWQLKEVSSTFTVLEISIFEHLQKLS